MSREYPKLGERVTGRCICCGRVPRNSETYGPHREGWDFTGVCPECWDQATMDPDDTLEGED